MAERLAKAGDVIQQGGAIPHGVVSVNDRMADDWYLTPAGHWHCGELGVKRCAEEQDCASGVGDPLEYAPLTVTAVREPEPRACFKCGRPAGDIVQTHKGPMHAYGNCAADGAFSEIAAEPDDDEGAAEPDELTHYRIPGDASALTLCGEDVWDESTSVTERAGSSNCTACRRAADEDTTPTFHVDEIFPTDESQQPVRATHPRGVWWWHPCGNAYGSAERPTHECDWLRCTETRAAWRPLFVGGDPTPKPPADTSWIKTTDGPNEPTWQEVGDHFLMEALGVERLDEVMPAIERLKVERDAMSAHADFWEGEAQRLKTQVREEIEQADEHAAWATRLATAVIARLDVPITEEAHTELWEAALDALKAPAAAPRQDGPRTLTLPEVPEGAVALVGVKSGRKYVPSDGSPRMWTTRGRSWSGELALVLSNEEGGVRVEMAPPREPRTWPKLDHEFAGDPPPLVDVADHGRWVLDTDGRYRNRELYPLLALTFSTLRALGDVSEVLDEPGGQR